MTKEEAIRRTESWWYCDNIVLHRDLIGLLHLGFPRVFILFRNEKSFVCDDFSSWKKGIAEVNFLDPDDRESSDLEEILTDAWNFCALQEQKEEELEDYYSEMSEM